MIMKDELRELIRNCDDELDDISKLLEKIDAVDKERMYLTNYALIKASGTIEFVYRSIVADSFHEKLHDDRIDNFWRTR